MKILSFFVLIIAMIVAINMQSVMRSGNKTENPCCNKKDCTDKNSKNQEDGFFLFQSNPFIF